MCNSFEDGEGRPFLAGVEAVLEDGCAMTQDLRKKVLSAWSAALKPVAGLNFRSRSLMRCWAVQTKLLKGAKLGAGTGTSTTWAKTIALAPQCAWSLSAWALVSVWWCTSSKKKEQPCRSALRWAMQAAKPFWGAASTMTCWCPTDCASRQRCENFAKSWSLPRVARWTEDCGRKKNCVPHGNCWEYLGIWE